MALINFLFSANVKQINVHIGVAATSRHRSFAVSGRIAEYCRVYPGCLAFYAAVFAAREIYGITNTRLLVDNKFSTHVKLYLEEDERKIAGRPV